MTLFSHSRLTRFAFALGLLAITSAQSARADDEFDVSVASGKVVVKTKGKWHINKEYPWALVVGESKLDKGKFLLSETAASVEAPKGAGTLRGGVCNGDQCRMFKKALTIE